MKVITTEKAIQNQIASAQMEEIRFNSESVDIIRKYTDNEISHEKLVELVAQMCNRVL